VQQASRGNVKAIGAGLKELLSMVSIKETRLEFKQMKPIACVFALGIK
jgi:hypothetical protein